MPAASPVRILAGIFLVSLAVLAVPCLFRKPGDWERVYVPAGERLRTGGDVFDEPTGFVYPPFAGMVAVPSAILPRFAARGVWWVANSLAVAVLFAGAWRLSGGQLTDPRKWNRREIATFWLGLVATVGFSFDTLTNQQTDLILAGLVVGGCWLVAGGRDVAGGVTIGLAAAAKCTPLLFALYFAWTGRWRAAAGVFAIAVGANLLPDAIIPTADGHLRLVEWTHRFLPGVASTKVDPGVWFSGVQFNHSLGGLANRLFTATLASANGIRFPLPREDRISAGSLKFGVLAVGCGLALVAGIAARRRRIARDSAFASEVGMALTLMLLLSPMSSKPHFCTLILPAWLIARGAMRGNLALRFLGFAGLCCGLAANKDLVGGRAYDTLLWYGLIPVGTLIGFAGCCLIRWQAGNSGASTPPPTDSGSATGAESQYRIDCNLLRYASESGLRTPRM